MPGSGWHADRYAGMMGLAMQVEILPDNASSLTEVVQIGGIDVEFDVAVTDPTDELTDSQMDALAKVSPKIKTLVDMFRAKRRDLERLKLFHEAFAEFADEQGYVRNAHK